MIYVRDKQIDTNLIDTSQRTGQAKSSPYYTDVMGGYEYAVPAENRRKVEYASKADLWYILLNNAILYSNIFISN